MFDRFTRQARQVIVLAQEEARRLQHGYIGTEHLLLGLLREGQGLAGRALASLGVSYEVVVEEVRKAVGTGSEEVSGHIPFTPRAKKVLEMALRVAARAGDHEIRTEHILQGLVEEGEGVAARVLRGLGVERARLTEVLGAARPEFAEAISARSGVLRRIASSVREGQAGIDARLAAIDARLAAIDARLAAIEARLAAIEARLGGAEGGREKRAT